MKVVCHSKGQNSYKTEMSRRVNLVIRMTLHIICLLDVSYLGFFSKIENDWHHINTRQT